MMTAPPVYTKKNLSKNIQFILLIFILSRLIVYLLGIHFDYSTLYSYWQYLDIATLQNQLLRGVWYDHTQPPAFNLFLGVILKLAGNEHAAGVFACIFKLITLANTLLIYHLLKQLTGHQRIALILSLIYLLSPGTIVFENELFYTSFISFFFLISAFSLSRFTYGINWKTATGFFLPLAIICFTRSMYHVILLIIVTVFVCGANLKKQGAAKLMFVGVITVLLCGSWYLKNYLLFGKFSTSTWIGMNIARNIFHDNEITDSSRIESVEPFQEISTYKRFLEKNLEKKYAGLNDRDLLQEMKNDTFKNEKHISFIEVSDLYMEAGKKHIKDQPVAFMKNVAQSAVIFFAPATRYSGTEAQTRKLMYYDAAYSFNLSHFVTGKQNRRIALTLSAIPYMLLYVFTFWVSVKEIIRRRRVGILNGFIILIIAYVFTAGSLLEHYENMRFRYELQPLFLLLLAQAIVIFLNKRRTNKERSIKA